MTKWPFLIGAAVLCGACASAQPQPPAAEPPPAAAQTPPKPVNVEPVGIYDFTTAVEGMVVNGTITVVKTETGYGGTVTTSVTEPIPVRSAVAEGQKLTVVADTPDGALTLIMEFTGDDFSGTWSMPTMSGTHTGKRRKA